MANVDSGTHSLASKQREAAAKAARDAAAKAAKTTSAPATMPPPDPATASAEAGASNPSVAGPLAKSAPVPTTPVTISPSVVIECDDRLSPVQRNAITLLAQGRSIKSTATQVGVHRDTVHRWLREDPVFRAAYHTWQAEALESLQGELLSLGGPAMKTYRRAVRTGDVRAAGQVLKGLGVLAPPRPGPQDSEEIRRVAELERKERESALIESETAAAWRSYEARNNCPWLATADAEAKAEAAEKARQPGESDSPKKPE